MTAPIQMVDPIVTAQASGDLSASQFCAMQYTSSSQLALPSAGGSIAGILQNNPNAVGKAGELQIRGISKAKLGGTVTAGDMVKVDSSGRFVTASASDIAAGAAVGQAWVGGAINQIGSVSLDIPGSGQVSVSGTETVTSGALSVSTLESLTSTTGSVSYTLANGTFIGQRKIIREITAASTPAGTLTIATTFNSEPTVYVFHAIGQEIELEWTATGWHLLRKLRAGTLSVVVGTTVLTGYLLTQTYNLSVTGTVTSSGNQNIPAPTLSGEYIRVLTGTAASLPNGTIGVAGFTKALVAATNLAGINATTCTASFLSNGASWDNEQLTTATYS